MNWLNKLRGQNVKGFFVIECVTSFCKKFIILYNKFVTGSLVQTLHTFPILCSLYPVVLIYKAR